MGLKKSKSLKITFIQYVITLGILIMGLILIKYYMIMFSIGVYPANYSENIIQKNFHELKNSPIITMDLLTPMCSFGIYSEDGQYLYGNFSFEDQKHYWNRYLEDKRNVGLSNYITSIDREEEVLIISYPLRMEYKNETIRKILPNAELTIAIIFFLELITVIILWSNRYSRKINKELKSLLIATSKISKQDLDFNVGESNILEINNVLKGIDKMKNSLKESLEEQWSLEQRKREQISALAHDIKTPLTIVKGNIGLLMETPMTPEQKNYCKYIEESSQQMESYIQSLLKITKKELDYSELPKVVSISNIINSLKKQGEALSLINDIKFRWNINIEGDLNVQGDKDEIERALMNIISNAVDFSPNNATITINIFREENEVIIQVIDEGKGFSKKMLKYGKYEFSMEDESRTKTGHHGLGLYIANTIITKCHGDLILSNDVNGGGFVTIKLVII